MTSVSTRILNAGNSLKHGEFCTLNLKPDHNRTINRQGSRLNRSNQRADSPRVVSFGADSFHEARESDVKSQGDDIAPGEWTDD